ncbi:MAG TPA: hypothetical protein PKA82_10910 [Pyrinomonadaceae bacterium]|nr:hypothetical protein [Pyrinomonadaceae bacterium]
MVAYLYKWKIKPGFEEDFRKGWTAVTQYHLEHSNSLGSRLHRGTDGLFYAYACWPSSEAREQAFANSVEIPERQLMIDAIEESFPSVEMSILDDLLL